MPYGLAERRNKGEIIMNEDFTFYYQGRDGTMWYRCTKCGYLTRGKPRVCPVCEGKGRRDNEDED